MNISWLYNGMILIQRDGFGPHFKMFLIPMFHKQLKYLNVIYLSQ